MLAVAPDGSYNALQKDRITGTGRDLLRSPCPHDHIHVALQHLQEWRPHNLPGQPLVVLRDFHRKNVFPNLQKG